MADEQIPDRAGDGLAERIRKFARNGLTRRTFMVAGGTATAGAIVNNALGPGSPRADQLSAVSPQNVLVGGSPDYIATLRRPKDQCVLTFGFYNLTPDFSVSPPVITVINSAKSSYLVVAFGAEDASAPQHVAEEAFPKSGGHLPNQKIPKSGKLTKPPVTHTPTVPDPAVNARLAGTTRIAFNVPNSAVAPASVDPMVLDADHLLNWVTLGLSVVPNAQPPFTALQGTLHPPAGIGPPVPPKSTQTAIQLPYGLVLSPPATPTFGGVFESTVFVNATQPVTHAFKVSSTKTENWTELWHTRLAGRFRRLVGPGPIFVLADVVDETDAALRSVRAVWATDSQFSNDLDGNKTAPGAQLPGFVTSLRYADRYDIVRLTSDFTPAAGGGPYGRTGVSDSGVPLTSAFVPAPADVKNLMLSSLGGWLDCHANWDLPYATGTVTGTVHGHHRRLPHYNSSLLSWRHRAVQGRDSYVRVVRKGYLFPWGHRASLITVTEREPTTNHAGQVGAYLRQRTFIVVSQPVKSYGGAGDFAPHAGRYMPFTSVETLTLVTPDLLAPAYFLTKTQQRSNTELVFEPKIATNTPFQFHMRGTDWAGDPIDFRSPVLWIDDTVAYGDGTGSASNKTLMSHVFAAWKKSSSAKSYPSISLHSQRVSVAAPKDPTKVTGDTQMVLSSVALSVVSPSTSNPQSLINASQPAFYPALHSLTIKLPQAGSVSGHAIADTVMAYDSHYLSNGFTNNKGGIFLRRSGSTRNPIKFANQNSGGSVAPNLTVDGYSRELGPASGSVTQLTQGTFDPTQVFHSVDAKLLGGLDLSTILGLVTFGDTSTGGTPSSDNSQALQMTSVEHLNPHRIVTTLEWHPVVLNGGPTVAGQQIEILEVQNPDGNYANKSGGPANIPGSASIMDLHAVIITDLVDSTKSSATVVGQIREFNLNLFGKTGATYFIQIPFSSLTFRAQSGHKTDVDVQVDSGGIAFQGALSFVQDLATYLNFDGSGLTVDTSGSGISATLTLAIPSIGIGLFALENIAFSAGVIIPYNGDPVRFTFAFCSQENPFQLEIMIFTGGGYIALEIGADGVERLEFGFDFGFGLSIDVGIASGQVSLTGGVSYSCAQLSGGGQEVDLTAYVKASGGISALGLVSVSVEMCLSLEYQSDGVTSSLAGDAEMSISVHIIFFGFSVGFDVHEDFAGSDPNSGTFANSGSFASKAIGDRFSSLALADSAAASTLPPWVLNPKPNSFGTAMAQGDWDQYCTSFALLGV